MGCRFSFSALLHLEADHKHEAWEPFTYQETYRKWQRCISLVWSLADGWEMTMNHEPNDSLTPCAKAMHNFYHLLLLERLTATWCHRAYNSLGYGCSSSHENSPNGNVWGIPYAPIMFGCGLATNTHAPPLLTHLRLIKLLDTDPSISTLVPSCRRFANGAAAFSIHPMNCLSYSSGQVLRRT